MDETELALMDCDNQLNEVLNELQHLRKQLANAWRFLPVEQLPKGLRDEMAGRAISGDAFVDLAISWLERNWFSNQ